METDPGTRLWLFLLPPYSPERNPDEWVWKNVKHDRIGKAGITSAEDCAPRPNALQRLPGLVTAFFSDPQFNTPERSSYLRST